jgi:hypothetical protein
VVYCSGTTTLTSASDCFSDGSDTADYLENSDCNWLIQPPGATSITLSFSSFETENGWDSVYVYDGASVSDPVLGSFTGNSLPADLTSSGGSMLVHFVSDYLYNEAGWVACYTSDTTSTSCNISLAVTGTDATCLGCSDGMADLTVTGAIGPVTYLWSNAQTTEDVSGLAAGTYFVTASDSAGCSAADSVLIGEFSGYCSGTVNLSAASDCFNDGSGTASYMDNSNCKWLIQPSGAASITLSFSAFATEAGYDSVTVYDGATTSDPILGSFSGTSLPSSVTSTGGAMLVHFESDVTFNDAGWEACYTSTTAGCTMSLSLTGTNVSCNGGNDGAVSSSVTGGTTPYSYNWSTGDTTMDISGVAAGTYTLIVTDAASCADTASVTLTQPTAVSASISGTDASCNGCTDGAADLSVSGGTTPYAYNWSNGATTEDLSNLAAASYSVTVTDAYGCTQTASVVISEPAASYCSGTTNLTTPAASFSDGSGANDYLENSDCKWLIQPSGAASITLSFSAFATEAGYDSVTVYDGATTSDPILGSFSGSSLPAPVTSTGGAMLVHFTSDSIINAAGWDASYTITTNIVEEGGPVVISIYPNPNQGVFTYSFKSSAEVEVKADMVNVLGEVVWIDLRKKVSGSYSKEADIRNLPAGIYFLNISVNGTNHVHRILRE